MLGGMASCNIRMTTVAPNALMEEILTTTKSTTLTLSPSPKIIERILTTTDLGMTTTIKSITIPSTISISKTAETNNVVIDKNTSFPINDNTTSTTASTVERTTNHIINAVNRVTDHAYNRTEIPFEGTSNDLATHVPTTSIKVPIDNELTTNPSTTTASVTIFMSTPKTSSRLPLVNVTQGTEETLKVNQVTTGKHKAKEIWIKPTQNIASNEMKIKIIHDNLKNKSVAKNDSATETTTPRTIIVSIIPTSASSHSTFKRIALTTASYIPRRTLFTKSNNKTELANKKSTLEILKPTVRPFTIKILSTSTTKSHSPLHQRNFTERIYIPKNKSLISFYSERTTRASTNNITNSMPLTVGATLNGSRSFNTVTIPSSTNTVSIITNRPPVYIKDERKYLKNDSFKIRKPNVLETTKLTASLPAEQLKTSTVPVINRFNNETTTQVNLYSITSENPTEDEMFHVLTEPEHITAVMSDKERNINSVDLISVVSIAGGIMMLVITVAVIIVMLERCRKFRYDDLRKINDIRMQVMIDNNDVPPPPYVRSIFHSPLPDPPNTDRCHYQPISTLDRNLKQFMRPVVVQNISPIMLENFRGILECHYDHLPRRAHDICISGRSSVATSTFSDEELHSQRTHRMSEYTIEALKCEAKQDVIENNMSSEPLYAEIPCWRPPSEHAIEVMNLNGEAVTEL
ncbi:uncharacterized protein LOC126964976 isoform X1 [Leptidea sinapis]|uniref:uncharacterized protein LOC126964976 isoform X1 n=1 Tax=Leptidea sinapis TaxID=189913 RepID=UPI0021C33834|nr:uncharacterized protein LOC126964976 isoform X1 [Leptidea sinapis]